MGWVERKLSGQDFWDKVKETKPLIKQRADTVLRQLGYDPQQLHAEVYLHGEGEEVWTVAYWHHAPENPLGHQGDLEVYLDNSGRVRRVVKFEDGQEHLIYGKDQRLQKGLTPEEVVERLGEPDSKDRPPRWARDISDQVWTYKRNVERTRETKVYFKNGEVVSFGYF
jgi:hypothetical protein